MAEANPAAQQDHAQWAWHAVPAEVADAPGTEPGRGLDEQEARQRRQRSGATQLTPPSRRAAFMYSSIGLTTAAPFLLLAVA